MRPDSEQFVSFFQAKLIIDNHDLRFVMLIHFTLFKVYGGVINNDYYTIYITYL